MSKKKQLKHVDPSWDDRKAMLDQPHMKPLKEWVLSLRERMPGIAVPDFDPCDGGVNARVLLIQNSPAGGAECSKFVSRDNENDHNAARMGACLAESGLSRQCTLLWNRIPWSLNHGFQPELSRATLTQYLKELTELLPRLRTVILVGGEAKRFRTDKDATSILREYRVIDSLMPANYTAHRTLEIVEKFRSALADCS